ncbi:aldo/keto reductase [Acaryochloris sp. IP29b_bin.148]|uniref:aldo/keto reductase n=1 Tax=Acaryochloris sp. IP29b_bin.148 TaxID=2969218 RepID=UPI002625EBFF|nr:aldo/keto reductase [Acaryochloris sp. IP29b_bin.148]
MSPKTQRRTFLASSLAAAGGLLGSLMLHQDRRSASRPEPSPPKNSPLPKRVLGKTGVKLPILGLGGAGQTPLSQPGSEKQAVEMIQEAWNLGIRYFDTAASYGPSEDYLGKVLPQYRSHLFLASKTARRDRDGAWQELERSLNRLNTDHLDLWQLHHVSFADEIDTIFSANGAIKAIEEAKSQGIIKFAGITGHHEPKIIIDGLNRYAFDTTLIPVNAADVHHPRPFISSVLPVARQQQIGVIAMKVPAYGKLLRPGVLSGMSEAMGYSLSQPGVHTCIIAAETVEQLTANVQTAQAFQALDATTLANIEKRTQSTWEDHSFFRAWA